MPRPAELIALAGSPAVDANVVDIAELVIGRLTTVPIARPNLEAKIGLANAVSSAARRRLAHAQ